MIFRWKITFDTKSILLKFDSWLSDGYKTAVLSWHVQNFVVISALELREDQNKIFIKFVFWAKYQWDGPMPSAHPLIVHIVIVTLVANCTIAICRVVCDSRMEVTRGLNELIVTCLYGR